MQSLNTQVTAGTGRIAIPLTEHNRYISLEEIIRKINAKTIIEVGVSSGFHSRQMISAALETDGDVFFYGFDLFDLITPEITEFETAPVKSYKKEDVEKWIMGRGVRVELTKGFSKDTLPEFAKRNIKADFIYIDGGHSNETCANDWSWCQNFMHNKTVVVFDDYIRGNSVGWGSNKTVDSIDRGKYSVEIVEPGDDLLLKVKGEGKYVPANNSLVKVWMNIV